MIIQGSKLVDLVYKQCKPGIFKRKDKVEKVLRTFVSVIQKCLSKGYKITISGIGSFGTRKAKAHIARNMKDFSPIHFPAHMKVTFKPSRKLRKIVMASNSKKGIKK